MYIHFPLYLTEALNKSSVPTLWKAAVVLPIQKKKGDLSLGNFRPISVLPTLPKLLEKIVYCQLIDYLLSNSLLCSNQSGFRPSGYSTCFLELQIFGEGS